MYWQRHIASKFLEEIFYNCFLALLVLTVLGVPLFIAALLQILHLFLHYTLPPMCVFMSLCLSLFMKKKAIQFFAHSNQLRPHFNLILSVKALCYDKEIFTGAGVRTLTYFFEETFQITTVTIEVLPLSLFLKY